MLPHNLQEFQGEDDSSVRMQCQWTDELPPLVTGKSQESHCFKNVRVLPTKYLVIIKEWVTQTTLTEEFKGFRCQNEFWKQKNLNFLWTHVLLTTDAGYLKSENVFQPGYISILQPLELRIIGHSNITESNLWEKNISMVDHKLLHDAALMKVNALDAQCFIAESWCCGTLIWQYRTVFWNVDLIELKAGLSFEEYVSVGYVNVWGANLRINYR